ncbi:MAG: phosphatase PAP2 family protein [Treponema sp.]|jgi:membrane-associated phospholipid phosphatase|nr:phosphatase PAP2 family protein [Treponema sp.]
MKKPALSFLAVAAALLIIGTFFDLPIDERIYTPGSAIANFLAVFGMFPQYAVEFLPQTMLFAILFEKRRSLKIKVMIPVFAALLLITTAWVHDFTGYLKHQTGLPSVFLASMLCFFILVFALAALPFAKKKPNELFTVALTGLIAFNAGYAILQVIKTFWGRQRFFTMDNPAEQFTKWFLPQGKAASDSFKSFPSGHSFAAMCAVWFAFWPRFIDCLKKYTRLILVLAILFGLAVMTSRLVLGRHFLSDVTAGASLSLASFALADYFTLRYFKPQKKERDGI